MTSLERELPEIRRARDYHLYDRYGRRYLDLYLDGGRALLGHRPERVLNRYKDALSKGLAAGFPSPSERRLARMVSLLLPGFPVFRLYRNRDRATALLAGRFPGTIADDAVAPWNGEPAAFWRPFLETVWNRGDAGAADGPDAVLPIVPLPGSFAPCVVCLRPGNEEALPPSDAVSPALVEALCAALTALDRFVPRFTEEHWTRFDRSGFKRRGPYLCAACNNEEYSALFRRSLEQGIVISPVFPGPSIVPAAVSDGEIERYRAVFPN